MPAAKAVWHEAWRMLALDQLRIIGAHQRIGAGRPEAPGSSSAAYVRTMAYCEQFCTWAKNLVKTLIRLGGRGYPRCGPPTWSSSALVVVTLNIIKSGVVHRRVVGLILGATRQDRRESCCSGAMPPPTSGWF